ncbi:MULTISPECIES: hypothetical protein [Wolbachia]|uniref:Uncharacterized protein n=2 Tax=unclassified Wolbachia TaxID=2640676 RepID=A0AAU8MK17_9RICK|nr:MULTISPECIES: hypothetical protein [Wolbachia]MBS9531539.1 hypothetical protein [Wolbachia endosymbiont of Rhagoletis cerasi]PBQ28227.1 hypothetical protein BTO27_02050 [Wolbachia pipientis wAus]QEK89564.1 hypothetical protein CAI20_02405 [Wolbachia endosymbiont of Chrysomya megacephala]UFO00127.1 hypothetical protein LOK48_05005 [Wolbachia endosymbiont of Corcyra cephalonica]UXX39970.1 hypothetical protein MJ631_05590 [Wolbachia endosymbiont of Oryzaephilus surinamensis]
MVNNKEKQVDLLLELLSANIGQVSSSVILKRIEKLSDNFHGRNNHNSHCQFDRDGGGHGNICWADKIKEDLTENYHKKDREISI